ncbi:MAG: TadE/TadG family type IV pilus assembly protein [Raoultibacter sp.]
MLKLFCNKQDKEKSQAANSILGFAVLLPILLLLVCCIVEAGNMYLVKTVADNVCCDAVRALEQRPQTTYTQMNEQVKTACSFIAAPEKVTLGWKAGATKSIEYNYRFFNQKTGKDDFRPSHYVYTLVDVNVSVEETYLTPIGNVLQFAGINFDKKGYIYVAKSSGAVNSTNSSNW